MTCQLDMRKSERWPIRVLSIYVPTGVLMLLRKIVLVKNNKINEKMNTNVYINRFSHM